MSEILLQVLKTEQRGEYLHSASCVSVISSARIVTVYCESNYLSVA